MRELEGMLRAAAAEYEALVCASESKLKALQALVRASESKLEEEELMQTEKQKGQAAAAAAAACGGVGGGACSEFPLIVSELPLMCASAEAPPMGGASALAHIGCVGVLHACSELPLVGGDAGSELPLICQRNAALQQARERREGEGVSRSEAERRASPSSPSAPSSPPPEPRRDSEEEAVKALKEQLLAVLQGTQFTCFTCFTGTDVQILSTARSSSLLCYKVLSLLALLALLVPCCAARYSVC